MASREHDASSACWCGPVTLAYGDEIVYDAEGNVIEINRNPSGSDVIVHNDDVGAALNLDPRYLTEGNKP